MSKNDQRPSIFFLSRALFMHRNTLVLRKIGPVAIHIIGHFLALLNRVLR